MWRDLYGDWAGEKMENKLKQLLSLCKCGVFISVNEHRDYYETVEKFIKEKIERNEAEIDNEVLRQMIKLDTIIELHFYPVTPVGFYEIFHYDLEVALDIALETLRGD
jgi:hypothetical protein